MERINLVSLKLVREKTLSYPSGLDGPAAAATLVQKYLADRDREHFLAVYLDHKHKPLAMEVSAVGTATTVLVNPGVVYRGALLVGATAVLYGHNHPSGDPSPSEQDYELTVKLIQAGDLLGIRVIDHLVIGDRRWVSIREQRPRMGWS